MNSLNEVRKNIFDCCVIGMGYIGLPTAVMLAFSNRNKVLGVDINQKIVERINEGYSHFFEPELDNLITNVIKEKKLFADTKPYYAKTFLITVPTPITETKAIPEPNLEYVFKAAESIAPYIKEGNNIILESTSPIGTTRKLSELIIKLTGLDDNKINFAYCPERVLPGNIIFELKNNDRVVGGIGEKAANTASDFYSTFCEGKILKTSAETAEMVKLSENAFRDVNLAFANELSIICDKKNINIRELIKLANQHPRVNILEPSCGVGGHCIAVDPWFLVSGSEDISTLIQTGRKVNEKKISWCIKKIKFLSSSFEKEFNRKPVVGCFGLTFKPDVEDLRNSPALTIVDSLIKQNFKIKVCEPNISKFRNLEISDVDDVITKSDLLIFLVAHSDFRNINLQGKDYIDFCGIITNS